MQGPALQQMNPDMRLFCACTVLCMHSIPYDGLAASRQFTF
jgi:hypothetical protein